MIRRAYQRDPTWRDAIHTVMYTHIMCVYIDTCIHIDMHTYRHTYIYDTQDISTWFNLALRLVLSASSPCSLLRSYACVYVCVYVCICTHMFWVHAPPFPSSGHMHVYMYVCMYAWVYTFTHMFWVHAPPFPSSGHMHVFVCSVCIYTHMFFSAHTYIYTYIQYAHMRVYIPPLRFLNLYKNTYTYYSNT